MQLIQSILMVLCGGQFTVEVVPAFTVEVQAVQQPAKSGRYLVKFTGDHCPPCKSWDRNELPALKAAGFTPTIIDSTHGNTWGVTSLPTFWVVDRATGKPVEKIVGYTSAETLIGKINDRPDEATKPIVATPAVPAPAQKQEHVSFSIYSGKAGSSHENRASLIDHLLNEGIHSGRHTSQQLNAMTDSELNYVHESDHGWSHSQSQPVVRIQQSACPGGNCPSPQNRAQRRGGFLRGLFR